MKSAKVFSCVLLPALCAFVAFGLQTTTVRHIWAKWAGTGPVIIFPSTIDLGEREQGQVVVTRFTISNDGVGDLQIQDVSTNCSCSGLEVAMALPPFRKVLGHRFWITWTRQRGG
jgi:hypothetical protein